MLLAQRRIAYLISFKKSVKSIILYSSNSSSFKSLNEGHQQREEYFCVRVFIPSFIVSIFTRLYNTKKFLLKYLYRKKTDIFTNAAFCVLLYTKEGIKPFFHERFLR